MDEPRTRRRVNSRGAIAAVVLAAGRSSRMGAPKPLLPLGSTSAIERVVGTVARAGVDDIVVVTGHEPERLSPVLRGLPVRPVHNAGYDAGMFSSVRAGVAALDPEVEAFFILPVDYPLVRSEVLDRLITEFRGAGHGRPDTVGDMVRDAPGVLHPTCCGRRGHPPLLAGRYREALLKADAADNLHAFLLRRAGYEAVVAAEAETEVDVEVDVEVEDLTILLDMDTADDYQRLRRLAVILDQAESAHGGPSAAGESGGSRLSEEDALWFLQLLEVPDRVVRHCRAVSRVGGVLAAALAPHVPALDVELVRIGGLLHDLARASTAPRQHAQVGQRILGNLGLSRLSAIVGTHMVLSPEHLESPSITEEQLVYLADKLVAEDRVVSLEERTARTLRELGGAAAPPGAQEGLRARMQTARRILDRVEAALGRSPAGLLASALEDHAR